jgi:hypothetical protein
MFSAAKAGDVASSKVLKERGIEREVSLMYLTLTSSLSKRDHMEDIWFMLEDLG